MSSTPVHAPEPSDDGSGSRWADLMRRALGFDVLACPRCGGRLRLIALLDESAVTQRILRHLGLPTEVPEARPARAPPLRDSDAWSSATRHAPYKRISGVIDGSSANAPGPFQAVTRERM